MMNLRTIDISKRLWCQMAIVVAGIGVLLLVSLEQLNTALLKSKVDNTRMLIETAYSVLDTQHQRFKNGEIDEATAKAQAITAITQLRYDDGNYFWINDMVPNMIFHPLKPALNGKDLRGVTDPEGKTLFVAMVDVVKASGQGSVAYKWPMPGSDKPVDKISYVKGFQPWGWVVGSGVYIQDVKAAFWRFASLLLFICGAIALVVGLLSWLISRSISLPVREVVSALNNIASGNGDLTQQLPVTGDDELSRLAIHFNEFTQKIRSILLQVQTSTIDLNGSSVSLSESFTQSLIAINHQKNESTSVISAMSEMLQASASIAENAEQSAASARHAEIETSSGRQVVVNTSNVVSQMSKDIETSASVIDKLAKDSQAIVRVLEVIRSIAEQTNLLALNAAIESARAGEQGRGFAVVADEVRNLAAKTQTSTEEIRQMIELVSAGGTKAVNAMHTSCEATKTAAQMATKGVESLTQISNEINTILMITNQTASAAEQQSQVAKEINRSLGNILDASNKTYNLFEHAKKSEEDVLATSKKLQNLLAEFRL